jgi:hypothetical protein
MVEYEFLHVTCKKEFHFVYYSINIITERCGLVVILLPYIRDVKGSNLGPDTGYPDLGFRGFPRSFQANIGKVP